MREMLYCTAGLTNFGVIKDEIIRRDEVKIGEDYFPGFLIHAKRIFIMQIAPDSPRIARPQGTMDFIVAVYNNVEVICNIICDLEPESQLYKGVMSGLEEKEGGRKTQ